MKYMNKPMEAMMNCKEEFLDHIEDREVLCAEITHQEGYSGQDTDKVYWLDLGFCPEKLSRFLNNLDFDYDDGYGSQHVFGLIWYKDGTWSERHEYDGSECWEHRRVPAVPKRLGGE